MYERQSEYWTSRQIEESLTGLGFQVLTYPLAQFHENKIPADFLFRVDPTGSAGEVKLFGLQYKALYRNGGDHWPVDATQHGTMLRFPWLAYCLSELRQPAESGIALHLARFIDASAIQPTRVDLATCPLYRRWGPFIMSVLASQRGQVVGDRAELAAKLRLQNEDVSVALADLVADVIAVNREIGHVVHLAPDLLGERQ